MIKLALALLASGAIVLGWYFAFDPKIGGVFWIAAFAVIASLIGILILIVSVIFRAANAPSKKPFLIGLAIVALLAIFALLRSPLTKWSGYVFTSKHDAEGNFLNIGEFPSKDACVVAAEDAVTRKQSVELSNYKDRGKIEVDSFLCGRLCFFPDGPGDVAIGEIDCSDMVKETVKR